MKSRILLVLCFSLMFSQAAFSQEVAEVQQTLITKKTATWCPLCGGWGWTFFESLLSNTSDKAVLVAAHFGGSSLESTTSKEWVDNLGGTPSQPRFFLNNDELNVTSSNMAAGLNTAIQEVDENALQSPVANVGLQTSWNGDDLNIQTKTRFFQNAEGAYYLGIYLVEDGVLATQAGQVGQVEHHVVLREGVSPGTFGDLLASGSIDAGTEFDKSYTASIDGYNLDKLDIVGVIWKNENGKYLVVNVWSIDAKPTVASTSSLEGISGLRARVQPNLVTDQAVISLELEKPQMLSILVLNAQGQAVLSVFRGQLQSGRHMLPIDVQAMNVPGWYSVLIQTDDGAVGALPLVRQ